MPAIISTVPTPRLLNSIPPLYANHYKRMDVPSKGVGVASKGVEGLTNDEKFIYKDMDEVTKGVGGLAKEVECLTNDENFAAKRVELPANGVGEPA